ncbi:MAG: ParB/RepB/Spo0J family partition protein [Armatimonadetes bacterium]|nr:ParB/RepB/Spo0J family partition protein [Armatimonadota bacterium]
MSIKIGDLVKYRDNTYLGDVWYTGTVVDIINDVFVLKTHWLRNPITKGLNDVEKIRFIPKPGEKIKVHIEGFPKPVIWTFVGLEDGKPYCIAENSSGHGVVVPIDDIYPVGDEEMKDENSVILVNIDDIYPNPANYRKTFDEESLSELASSIKTLGILQPLIVTDENERCKVIAGTGKNARYRIIAGERRWRAAKMAGLEKVPVIVKQLTAQQEAEAMLIENLQRKDLDPIEEAQAYQTLLKDYKYTQEQLAEKIGISQAQVANRLRLLRLPADVQGDISRKILSAAHGLALVKLVGSELFDMAFEEIRKHNVPANSAGNYVDSFIRVHGKPLYDRGWGSPVFDTQEHCIRTKCKFRVHAKSEIKEEGEHPYCVNPSCWDEKQKVAKEKLSMERVSKVLEKRKSMGSNGDESDKSLVIDSKDLNYGDYRTFNEYSPDNPKSDECKVCDYFKIIKFDSGYLSDACLNPKCFEKKEKEVRKLRQQQEREEKKDFEQVKNEVISKALKSGELDNRTLAFLAIKAFENVRLDHSSVNKLKTSMGWDKKIDIKDKIKKLDKNDLIKFLLYVFVKPIPKDDHIFNWWAEGYRGA